MKKAGILLMEVIITAMLLCGCGGAQNNSTAESTGNTMSVVEESSEEEGSAASDSTMAESTETEDVKNSAGTETVVALEESSEGMENLTAQKVVSQMKLGWNLGNTLDSLNSGIDPTLPSETWETAWGNPVTTEELMDTIIAEGFNVIRIPVSWNDHLLPGEGYQIEESWMNRVQEVVDYAYDSGAYVIINAHHESWYYPYYDNQDKASEMLQAVWTQIAERFQDYDEHLIFEGMNEPRKIGTNLEWNGGDQEGWDVVNALNQVFVDTIRSAGGNNPYRILMIPGYAANCWEAPKHLIVPEDDKIVVSIHAYEPYDFALNQWGRGTWDEDTANIGYIMQSLDELFLSKGIPVVIGEFGAMHKPVEGNEAERAAWAEYYVRAAAEKGIPCVWWDNGAFEGDGELFGIIDRQTCQWRYPLIVEGLKKGLAE